MNSQIPPMTRAKQARKRNMYCIRGLGLVGGFMISGVGGMVGGGGKGRRDGDLTQM